MFSPNVPPTTRIASLLPSLQPSERDVAELVLARSEEVMEWTAQELADHAGVGRTTVMRACQSLGYKGYPQLRVALAAELGATQQVRVDHGSGVLAEMRTAIDEAVAALPSLTELLDADRTEAAVCAISEARRVLVVANGLSSAIALTLSMRLTSVGRYAEFIADNMAQEIAARNLAPGDLCIIISGSGANDTSLRVAAAAATAGARTIAITSFAVSALTATTELALVIAPTGSTMRRELERSSRTSFLLFVEVLVLAVAGVRGDNARDAHAQSLGVVGDHLEEGE